MAPEVPAPNSQLADPGQPGLGMPPAPHADGPTIEPVPSDPSAWMQRFPAPQQPQYGLPPQSPPPGVQPANYQAPANEPPPPAYYPENQGNVQR
jgi:hypothetical protein